MIRASDSRCLGGNALPAGGLDLTPDGPDESGELAGDGDDRLGLHDPARHKPLELGAQAQLRSPGDVDDGLGQLGVTGRNAGAHARTVLVMPGGLDQHAPGGRVARLGDAALASLGT